MTGPELNTTNDLLSKLLGTMGINCTTSTTNHTSIPTVVAYHTGPPHLAGPTAGLVLPGFPPKVHYTPTVPAGPNPTAPYNYNMMLAQSNVTPTGPPSQPTSITVQPGNVGLTALSGQATTIPHAFTTETLRDFTNGAWNMDTGASSHLNNSVDSLCEIFNTCMYPSISVDNSVRVCIIITHHIVKNLISVRQFVRDNNCMIKFDAFGFSVKDFKIAWGIFTRSHILLQSFVLPLLVNIRGTNVLDIQETRFEERFYLDHKRNVYHNHHSHKPDEDTQKMTLLIQENLEEVAMWLPETGHRRDRLSHHQCQRLQGLGL
nr:hypothetical protein [Tanacetum cinerariifolium]